jgi:hypothetical protein
LASFKVFLSKELLIKSPQFRDGRWLSEVMVKLFMQMFLDTVLLSNSLGFFSVLTIVDNNWLRSVEMSWLRKGLHLLKKPRKSFPKTMKGSFESSSWSSWSGFSLLKVSLYGDLRWFRSFL